MTRIHNRTTTRIVKQREICGGVITGLGLRPGGGQKKTSSGTEDFHVLCCGAAAAM